MQIKNIVTWAEHSSNLSAAITEKKRVIIIITVEKFSHIISKLGSTHKNNKFAIIIDEAHSGQSGINSAQMNFVLSGLTSQNGMDNEDKINVMMEGRKLLHNASYFAFTTTPPPKKKIRH